jgi:hypothetical protein
VLLCFVRSGESPSRCDPRRRHLRRPGRDEDSERAIELEDQGQLDEMPFWWSTSTLIMYFSVEDRISTSFFVQTTRFAAH